MLYSAGVADAAVFGGAATTMVLVAVVATSVPARRAIKVDPLAALRAD
jgi:ABC-type antimicrobial peptide transport system permease subunit